MKILVLAAALVPGWLVFAQDVAPGVTNGDSLSTLLTGSAVTVLAAGIIGFIRGWIVPGRQFDRLENENEMLRNELSSRNKEDREHLIPSIVASITEALRQTKSEGGSKA